MEDFYDFNTVATRPGADPYAVPLDQFNLANPLLFKTHTWGPFFKRLRDEDPVHYCRDSYFGPYWSITRFEDIQFVDSHHDLFSSAPNITIGDPEEEFKVTPGFIAQDPPEHDLIRSTVQSVVAPANLMQLEPLIRERVCEILDNLPLDEPFDWVERVSIELTTRMLATLFDFPFEDRSLLPYWSDVATSGPVGGSVEGLSREQRQGVLLECLEYFTRLWNERANRDPGDRLDLITMLAQGPATRNMTPFEYLGNLILLIVGGNDTTRNSLTGGVLALNQNPDEYDKLRANPELIPNMVSEIIRWQTPLAHMRRLATQDVELNGKRIKAGDKVVMWYCSGNRDERAIDEPDRFIIDRKKARHHLSFGFGIHRCMGNRLAEMQLRIVWEEVQQRFAMVEVLGEPERVPSAFVNGYKSMMVKATAA